MPGTPALLDLQLAFRASLLVGDDAGTAPHVVESGSDAAERLDVYRNTFASVLVNALRLSYPAVDRLVGADFFEAAARIFIAGHPPARACLDDYGADLADFLAAFAPAASLGYLPDVARLEWRVSRALHAEDREPLDAGRLAALAEADRASVRFERHPSVGLLQARHPVDAIWRAVLEEDDEALSAVDPGAGPVWLLVERRETGVEVRRMSEAAWRFAARLFAGLPLHAVLAELPEVDPPALLAEHLAAGRLVDFSLGDNA